jgi:hypothetical protein
VGAVKANVDEKKIPAAGPQMGSVAPVKATPSMQPEKKVAPATKEQASVARNSAEEKAPSKGQPGAAPAASAQSALFAGSNPDF